MTAAQLLLGELEFEARSTRAILHRVPADRLTWKPHDKSMTLGQLAMHIALSPGLVAKIGSGATFEYGDIAGPPQPASADEIGLAFEESLLQAKAIVGPMEDTAMSEPWSLTMGGNPVFSVPRGMYYRTILLNHLYHHRGQLSVYLRILGVALPSIYGPSADENPLLAANA
jgi:uncharacterized damage-inducible protein DinB